MRLSKVFLAVLALGCGGGGDGGPTGNGNGTGNGTGTGSGTGSGTGPSATATVSMRGSDDGYGSTSFSFSPAGVTVARGGTVTWSHSSDGAAATHNVTFGTSGAPANIANFSSGSASRTFNSAGSFSYSCTNHPGMTGSVTVQ